MRKYEELVNYLLNITGTRSQGTVNYLKDVSNMLDIVSTVSHRKHSSTPSDKKTYP